MSNRKSINNNYKINIIFNSSVKGHVLEYVHNIYMHVVNREEKFIFLLPENFNERKTNLEWPDAPNVSFCFITNEEERTCNSTNFYASSLALCRCTRKYAKIFKADNVFFIFLIRPMPFLPFYLPHGTKASGIIYAIPIYKSVQSRLQKIKDGIIYKLYASKKSIKNVFLLNDPRSVEFYNKKYGTNEPTNFSGSHKDIVITHLRQSFHN